MANVEAAHFGARMLKGSHLEREPCQTEEKFGFLRG